MGDGASLESIGKWMLALVVLMLFIYIFFTPGGQLEKVNKLVKSGLTKIGILKEETYVTEVKASEELQSKFDNFFDKLKISKKEGNCFLKYEKFGDLEDFKISLTQDNEKTYMKLVSPQTRTLDFKVIENPQLKLCAVTGMPQTKNFLANWHKSNGGMLPDYTSVNTLTFLDDEISLDNGKFYDNEDYGLIYKPDEDHICFFLTHGWGNWICDAEEKTMDDDCLEDILKKINKGAIAECKGEI